MTRIQSPDALRELQEKLRRQRPAQQRVIAVCGGTGCRAYNWDQLVNALRQALREAGLEGEVALRITGCHGFCERGPLVVIHPEKILYQQVQPEDVPELVEKTLQHGQIVERLLYVDPVTGKPATQESEVPFYRHQMRLVLAHNGQIDPTDIGDYLALGGYGALAKALSSMSPEEVIDEVKHSGLRGRGGGGFPTGRKWQYCRQAPGDMKYVICNADEGDPGAYMDRSLLEGNPHSVLEGMIIGGYAIGAHEGFVYVRNEYPLAVAHTRLALQQAKDYGLLGENILSSGFDFSVSISRGGGAFVCGESTALMASLEGAVGEPRAKYIHTVQSGLWNQPTTLNNVETWANVPHIVNRGARWYTGVGTEGSKGTKVFSLVGKVRNTGLVEVPMGITLRKLVFDIGGGISEGKRFKAVQTGGPSGGCIPESMIDLPVDFDELVRVGSMMGSGGMIVMDEDTCMVDVARYFLGFLCEESCGKCTSCREGLKHMLEILTRITQGEGREGDIELLEELSEVVKDTSLCALGQTAPNPVLTTIRYFRDEYEAHIKQKRCPAHVCKALVRYEIIPEVCTGCRRCATQCPQGAIIGERKQAHRIIQEQCVQCGICFEQCRFDAIEVR